MQITNTRRANAFHKDFPRCLSERWFLLMPFTNISPNASYKGIPQNAFHKGNFFKYLTNKIFLNVFQRLSSECLSTKKLPTNACHKDSVAKCSTYGIMKPQFHLTKLHIVKPFAVKYHFATTIVWPTYFQRIIPVDADVTTYHEKGTFETKSRINKRQNNLILPF